uniref:Uncharacterized protein n=1 Tax=Anguilla anguilla TaxID=7936 RepID=A0A0E9QJY3_ANGAN
MAKAMWASFLITGFGYTHC